MIIYDGFYLHGFTRIDKGEAGAVFERYGEAVQEKQPARIKESERYNNPAARVYSVIVPEPAPRHVVACAVVTRTSKNCYQATVYDDRRIEHFTATTLDGLRRVVSDFFEGVAV